MQSVVALVVGKELISYFNEKDHAPHFNYGLTLDHKHLPEIKFHNDLEFNPIFSPSVGRFYTRNDCINSNPF